VHLDRDKLIDKAIHAQRTVFRAMHAATEPAWLQLDLTMSQVKGLFALANGGALTIGALGGALGIGPPGASLLVNRLVHLGLVERAEDPADRRRALVRLTGRGEELVLGLRQGRRERLRAWLAQLSDADLAALSRGLCAMAVVAAGGDGAAPAVERAGMVAAGE
jgi:DNA-binding MarR family transcriptional regulator